MDPDPAKQERADVAQQSKSFGPGTWVLIALILAAGFVIFLLETGGPTHWLGTISSAEYRRCWALAENQIPPDFSVIDVVISDEEIRWTSSKWDGDKYLFAERICKRGSSQIERSAITY